MTRSTIARLLVRVLVPAAILLAGAEVAARVYWRSAYLLSMRDPRHVLLAFYPELRRVDGIHPARSDGFFEVLLLGGSVLHKNWGSVEQALVEQLAREGRHDVRVSNLAIPGQTSRDSLLKYQAMADARFDLVVAYDGINDVRMNNVPPALYRDDYSHDPWDEVVGAMAPYQGVSRFALPFTLRLASIRLRQSRHPDRYLPEGALPADWIAYGADARSAVSFEHNLRQLLTIASNRGDRVMLMTFATYLAPNYSLDAFRRHALDYDLHVSPIELWGRPDNVIAAVERQNDVVRKLAAERPDTLFVDQARLMPRGAKYFNDVCHLTLEGSSAFASAIVEAIKTKGHACC